MLAEVKEKSKIYHKSRKVKTKLSKMLKLTKSERERNHQHFCRRLAQTFKGCTDIPTPQRILDDICVGIFGLDEESPEFLLQSRLLNHEAIVEKLTTCPHSLNYEEELASEVHLQIPKRYKHEQHNKGRYHVAKVLIYAPYTAVIYHAKHEADSSFLRSQFSHLFRENLLQIVPESEEKEKLFRIYCFLYYMHTYVVKVDGLKRGTGHREVFLLVASMLAGDGIYHQRGSKPSKNYCFYRFMIELLNNTPEKTDKPVVGVINKLLKQVRNRAVSSSPTSSSSSS